MTSLTKVFATGVALWLILTPVGLSAADARPDVTPEMRYQNFLTAIYLNQLEADRLEAQGNRELADGLRVATLNKVGFTQTEAGIVREHVRLIHGSNGAIQMKTAQDQNRFDRQRELRIQAFEVALGQDGLKKLDAYLEAKAARKMLDTGIVPVPPGQLPK